MAQIFLSNDCIAIESGEMILGVLCKTETLDPYNGVFVLVCQKDITVEIASCNYIVLCISETRIRTENSLQDLMDDVTKYLISNYSSTMRNLPDFYRKFVYNESELYEDDYESSEY